MMGPGVRIPLAAPALKIKKFFEYKEFFKDLLLHKPLLTVFSRSSGLRLRHSLSRLFMNWP